MAALIWAGISLLLFILQFGLGVFDFLFPALAAGLTALVSLVVPGLGGIWWIQVLSFTAATVASVLVFRRKFRTLFQGDTISPESHRLDWTGKRALVLEAIAPGKPGRIKFRGTSWKASSLDESIPEGVEVCIVEQDGMSCLVSRQLVLDQEAVDRELQSVLEAPSTQVPEAPPARPDADGETQ